MLWPGRPKENGAKVTLLMTAFSLIHILSFSLLPLSSSAVLLTVTCCNGGQPRVLDGYYYPSSWKLKFLASSSSTISDKTTKDCIQYEAQTSPSSYSDSRILGCRCPANSGFTGDKCRDLITTGTDTSSGRKDTSPGGASSASSASSFKIFTFVAIIPLSFILFAIVGAFLCRMCSCAGNSTTTNSTSTRGRCCFPIRDYCRRCWSKDPDNLEGQQEAGDQQENEAALAHEALVNRRLASYRFEVRLDNMDECSRRNDQHRGDREVITVQPKPPTFQLPRNTPSNHYRSTNGSNNGDEGYRLERSMRKISPPPTYESVIRGDQQHQQANTSTAYNVGNEAATHTTAMGTGANKKNDQ